MFILIFELFLIALSAAACHEPSIAHPLPDYDATHPILRTAFEHIKALLTIAIAEPEYASTSFSAEITSSKESLWSFHHTARERNTSRPDIPQVNGDALYRIASCTKSFTVLGILKQHAAGNLSLDDPVDKYIERLREKQNGSIPWNSITLRSLASQLSGIPREFAQTDLINEPLGIPYTPNDLGLPPVSRESLLQCDEYSPNYETPCDAQDLLRTITAQDPVFAPNQKSTYSNVAFELLGLVLENVTNQSYESYIEDAIFKPLDMTKSTFSKPPDSAGVIPLNPQYYDVAAGIQNPTGGIYSSSTDMSKYLRYILNHYNSITSTVNWIHPVSPAKGLYTFYGMPWEIFQTDRVLLNSKRPIRFITKNGGLPGYTSIIMTIPEYDIGITVLLGGPSAFFPKLVEFVTVEMTRAAEQLAILQLQQRYVGTFVAPDPALNSSIALVADHRGLVIERFISNGTDNLNGPLSRLLGAPDEGSWYLQLVPTLLYKDEKEERGEPWRIQSVTERSGSERRIWDDMCFTDIDELRYAGLPLNKIVFRKGPSGMFDGLELTGFRVNLTRIFTDSKVIEQQEVLEL